MEEKETLIRIFEDADKKAKEIVQKSEEKKSQSINKANRLVLQKGEALLKELEDYKKSKILDAQKGLEQEKKRIVEKRSKEALESEKTARKNIEKAVEFLVEKFKDKVAI